MRIKPIGFGSRAGCGEGDGTVVGSGISVLVGNATVVIVGGTVVGISDELREQLDNNNTSSAIMKFNR